jgi:HPt (histidine-containing phosphotransfer) domain-containing protein
MNDKLKDIEEKFAAIKASYTADLENKLTSIEEYWHKLSNQGWDSENAKSLHHIIHGLAGSAETFGFPQITKLARHADITFKRINARHPDKMEIAELAKDLNSLISEIRNSY